MVSKETARCLRHTDQERDRDPWHRRAASDIAIFDPATVRSSNRGERRYDLPGGAKRMVMPSCGVEYTLVNGEVTWHGGAMTGVTAGKVLLHP